MDLSPEERALLSRMLGSYRQTLHLAKTIPNANYEALATEEMAMWALFQRLVPPDMS